VNPLRPEPRILMIPHPLERTTRKNTSSSFKFKNSEDSSLFPGKYSPESPGSLICAAFAYSSDFEADA
jgi:hypothetical protein